MEKFPEVAHNHPQRGLSICTVKRRKPDVRFGKPDTIVSGFQIVRILNVRFTTNLPDFRQRQLPKRWKSGHKCPVIGRQLPERLKSGRFCPDFRRLYYTILCLKTGYNVRFSDVLDQSDV